MEEIENPRIKTLKKLNIKIIGIPIIEIPKNQINKVSTVFPIKLFIKAVP